MIDEKEYKRRMLFGGIAFVGAITSIFLFCLFIFCLDIRILLVIGLIILFNLLTLPLSKYGSYKFWKKAFGFCTD